MRAAPRLTPTGAVDRWFGTIEIVDDRVAVEDALTTTEARLAAFMETVPLIVWTADATGWFQWYNARWYSYTGQTYEEAAGWGFQAAHHPSDFQRVMNRWPHSIATSEPFEMEFRLRGADGNYRWFLTRIVPQRDETGVIVRWYGSNTDIEEQKRAQQQSARIAETLQDAFLPDRLPVRRDMRFDAVYLPAERDTLVGGDWYDAFTLDDGRIVVSVGDVAGHGVRAAVSAGRLPQAIVAYALEHADPTIILQKANRVLRFQEATIASALVGIVDPVAMTMIYASAGHPPPIVARSTGGGRIETYTHSPPLGTLDELELQLTHVRTERDMVAIFYTDGFTEFDRDIESAERALEKLVAHYVGDRVTARPAAQIQLDLMRDVRPFDDAALLFVQWSPVDLARTRRDETNLVKTWVFHSSDAFTARSSRLELVRYLQGFMRPDQDLFTTELVIGELLANTVEHAPGLVHIVIDWSGEYPLLWVSDSGPGLRSLDVCLPADLLDENGRGLWLVATCARDVRIEPDANGTIVHVTLPLVR